MSSKHSLDYKYGPFHSLDILYIGDHDQWSYFVAETDVVKTTIKVHQIYDIYIQNKILKCFDLFIWANVLNLLWMIKKRQVFGIYKWKGILFQIHSCTCKTNLRITSPHRLHHTSVISITDIQFFNIFKWKGIFISYTLLHLQNQLENYLTT